MDPDAFLQHLPDEIIDTSKLKSYDQVKRAKAFRILTLLMKSKHQHLMTVFIDTLHKSGQSEIANTVYYPYVEC